MFYVGERVFCGFIAAKEESKWSKQPVEKADNNGKFVVYDPNDSEILKMYTCLSYDEWASIDSSPFAKYEPEKKSFYFDLDGTLAKWYPDMRGFEYEDIVSGGIHYFRDLEPVAEMIILAEKLNAEGEDVCVISASAKDTIGDKWFWIKDNLPFVKEENICFCPLGADKSKFIKGNAKVSVLFDDYNINLFRWKGYAVKVLNGVNHYNPLFDFIDTVSDTRAIENKLSRFFKGRAPGDTSATSRIRGRRYDYLRDCDSERFQEICYTLLQADEEAKYMLYCDGGTYVPARGFSEDDVKKRYWQLQEAIFPFYIKLGSSLRFDEFTRNYGSAVAEAGKNACDYCRDRDIDIDNTPKSNFTII